MVLVFDTPKIQEMMTTQPAIEGREFSQTYDVLRKSGIPVNAVFKHMTYNVAAVLSEDAYSLQILLSDQYGLLYLADCQKLLTGVSDPEASLVMSVPDVEEVSLSANVTLLEETSVLGEDVLEKLTLPNLRGYISSVSIHQLKPGGLGTISINNCEFVEVIGFGGRGLVLDIKAIIRGEDGSGRLVDEERIFRVKVNNSPETKGQLLYDSEMAGLINRRVGKNDRVENINTDNILIDLHDKNGRVIAQSFGYYSNANLDRRPISTIKGSPAFILEVLSNWLNKLEAIHQVGIVNADNHASNALYDNNGAVVLIDFDEVRRAEITLDAVFAFLTHQGTDERTRRRIIIRMFESIISELNSKEGGTLAFSLQNYLNEYKLKIRAGGDQKALSKAAEDRIWDLLQEKPNLGGIDFELTFSKIIRKRNLKVDWNLILAHKPELMKEPPNVLLRKPNERYHQDNAVKVFNSRNLSLALLADGINIYDFEAMSKQEEHGVVLETLQLLGFPFPYALHLNSVTNMTEPLRLRYMNADEWDLTNPKSVGGTLLTQFFKSTAVNMFYTVKRDFSDFVEKAFIPKEEFIRLCWDSERFGLRYNVENADLAEIWEVLIDYLKRFNAKYIFENNEAAKDIEVPSARVVLDVLKKFTKVYAEV